MPETATYREAIRRALREALASDERVLMIGEDIADAGGVFKVTAGLIDEFGPTRVSDTPISETAIVGAGIGLALAGFRPIVEIMFADFAAVAWDQIINQAAKYRYLSAGQLGVPLVIRASAGAGGRFGAQHSQTTESWYLSAPGLKVVAPANPQDAFGLLLAAVRDPDPVIYLEHKALYSALGALDANAAPPPLGAASVVRSGADVTVVASLAMVPRALDAADLLRDEGIDAEVIDLRSLVPIDSATIVASVERTTRLVTVEEQVPNGGWGSHVIAEVVQHAFDSLDAPPLRVGLPLAPIPFSPKLEDAALPDADRITAAIRSIFADRPMAITR
jgi:pyruvate/2-oxoglutarate/acetoin dehydrogenase E1 component